MHQKYMYKGNEIFVSPGLGHQTFGIFKKTKSGIGLKRIVTKKMPMVSTIEEAQKNLDKFAEENKLSLIPFQRLRKVY